MNHTLIIKDSGLYILKVPYLCLYGICGDLSSLYTTRMIKEIHQSHQICKVTKKTCQLREHHNLSTLSITTITTPNNTIKLKNAVQVA